MKMQESGENYLETILMLKNRHGQVRSIDIANELGNSKVANMVMLGAYIEVAHAVTVDTVMDNLKLMFGERKAHLLPINRQAIERGMECVREHRK